VSSPLLGVGGPRPAEKEANEIFVTIKIKSNQKVNLYSASSIKNSQTHHLHISTLKQPCLKSTLELFPGNVTAMGVNGEFLHFGGF